MESVSVLLAVYNGEKYIENALKSILNQTHTNFEILIGLNGTTDNSRNIIEKFNDNRIKIFDFGMDVGKAKTLNKLLNIANGNWLAIQDDDDIWKSNKLETQLRIISNFDYHVVGTNVMYIDADNRVISSPLILSNDCNIKLLTKAGFNQIQNSTALFSRKLAFEVGGWNESIPGASDMDFWLKLMSKNAIFINLKQVSVYHRLHEGSNFNTKKFDIDSILKSHKVKGNTFCQKVLIKTYIFMARLYFYFTLLRFKLIKIKVVD